uniref:Uncharacterized protein n=1 Tax=Arundo donax TaxID=35708 RepID=A0A0A9GX80_ARUDO
MPFCYPTS